MDMDEIKDPIKMPPIEPIRFSKTQAVRLALDAKVVNVQTQIELLPIAALNGELSVIYLN